MASKAAPLPRSADPAIVPVAADSRGSLSAVDWREMDQQIAQWDGLANAAGEPNPFFESWFLLPALRAFDPGHHARMLLFHCDGQLCGLLPVERSNRYYGKPLPHLAGWQHPNCFACTPLVAAGHEAAFCRALLRWADAQPGPAAFLHLADIATDGPFHAALCSELLQENRQGAITQQFERALLVHDTAPADYLAAALPKRKRHDLQRQFNRLSETGDLRFEWNFGAHGIEPWATQFLSLEASGWKGQAGSALACDPGTARLLHSALAGAAARARLVRLALLLDDQPIAMLANFLTPPGSFGFKTAFDERFARFSPGVLLEREYLTMLDHPGIAWCDSCAAPDHPVMNRLWRGRRPIAKLSLAIGGAMRRRLFRQLARLENTTPMIGNA